jgi:hypothetical protein
MPGAVTICERILPLFAVDALEQIQAAGTSNGHVLKQAFNKIIHVIAGKIKLETHQS